MPDEPPMGGPSSTPPPSGGTSTTPPPLGGPSTTPPPTGQYDPNGPIIVGQVDPVLLKKQIQGYLRFLRDHLNFAQDALTVLEERSRHIG